MSVAGGERRLDPLSADGSHLDFEPWEDDAQD